MRNLLTYTIFALWAVAAVWVTALEFVHHDPCSVPAIVEESEVCDAKSATLLFVGDIMAHLPQVRAAQKGADSYDFTPHLEGVRELLKGADYAVGNLETTLSPRPPYSGYPAFATPEELARDLRAVGFDALALANNHTADRGVGGVLATIAALQNEGLDHFGVAVPTLMQGCAGAFVREIGGFRLGFVAATYGANGPVPESVELPRVDTVALQRTIESVRSEVDYLFVLPHWGVEYARRPSAQQREVAQWLRSVGADFVVGSHPHVVQPWEAWQDESGNIVGGVFYSLGNFISNQNSPHTDRGMAVRIELRQEGEERATVDITTAEVVRKRGVGADGCPTYALEIASPEKGVKE